MSIFDTSLPVSANLKADVRAAFVERDGRAAAELIRDFGAIQVAIWLGELLEATERAGALAERLGLEFADRLNRAEIALDRVRSDAIPSGQLREALQKATEARLKLEKRLSGINTLSEEKDALNRRLGAQVRELRGLVKKTHLPKHLTPEQAAAIADTTTQRLAERRTRKQQPGYTRIGGKIKYPTSELFDWLNPNRKETPHE